MGYATAEATGSDAAAERGECDTAGIVNGSPQYGQSVCWPLVEPGTSITPEQCWQLNCIGDCDCVPEATTAVADGLAVGLGLDKPNSEGFGSAGFCAAGFCAEGLDADGFGNEGLDA